MSIGETFDEIYRANSWGGTESRSGPGSSSVEREFLAPEIVALVAELDVKSVLDVGCGETFWTPELPGYIGVDVSSEAVTAARKNHPGWDFRLDDGSPFPEVDLVMVRCVIQHLSQSSALALLDRIRATGARWLLATSYLGGMNISIDDGAGYWPDMAVAPFSMGEPVRSFEDGRNDYTDHGCILGLWQFR